MTVVYYQEALKLAQKELRACNAKGIDPYLPVLEDRLPANYLGTGVDLGNCDIPMEFIVGTRTSGRTQAFARNFMPLMADNSEFADKWRRLCKSHLEEGIRDAVKVYEYMNRYYVEEGNKRVSVLRFFDAESVYAHVIRLLPERDGSKEVELYYEYVDFYNCSRINFIEFTKPGSYVQLQRLVGKEPDQEWTEEERRGFFSAYHYFRQAYLAGGGKRLSSTAGDAMLAFIKVYGYQQLRHKGVPELKKSLASMWEEIALQQEEEPIELKLAPQDGKGGILTKVLPKTEPKPIKAAFLYDKTPELSGWTLGHELGRRRVQRVLEGQVETVPYFNAMDGEPLDVIEQAIGEGCGVVFTTSPRLLQASLLAAVKHPKVTILNCSLNMSHRYIRTYYARMYEAKFIAGAIAGSLCGTNDVGYICDYPIFGQVAGINAFALGVGMVNPRVKVLLDWSTVGGVRAAGQRLREKGIRLISSQDLARLGDWRNSCFGLAVVGEDGLVTRLATALWHWGVYYETILRRIMDKSFQSEYAESSKALNYYWGMSAGVVELRCSEKLPDGARRLAEILRDSICAGVCEPFRGPLYASGGKQVLESGRSLSPGQIIGMDWLAENVVGSLPPYDQLNDSGKAIVDVAGVDPSTREKETKNA